MKRVTAGCWNCNRSRHAGFHRRRPQRAQRGCARPAEAERRPPRHLGSQHPRLVPRFRGLLLREPCSRAAVDPANKIAVIDMPADERKRVGKSEWLLAVALIVAGTAISALFVAEIRASQPPSQFAQATQPTPSSPPEAQKDVRPSPNPAAHARPRPRPSRRAPMPRRRRRGLSPHCRQRRPRNAPPIRER